MGARAKAWCLHIHAEASLSLTGGRAKAWCLLIHAEASLSYGGQGESLVPPFTSGRVSLSRGPGRKPGASVYTRKRLSLTGGRAKAWCLLSHADSSLCHGGPGESMVPPYTRASVSRSLAGGRANAWCLLIHTESSLSLSGWRLCIHAEASLCISVASLTNVPTVTRHSPRVPSLQARANRMRATTGCAVIGVADPPDPAHPGRPVGPGGIENKHSARHWLDPRTKSARVYKHSPWSYHKSCGHGACPISVRMLVLCDLPALAG